MTVAELRALVEGNAEALSAIDKLVLDVETEKSAGISKYQKKDAEVMRYKRAMKELGYDHETHENVDAFVADLKATTDTAGEAQVTLQTVSDELRAVRQELDTTKQEKLDAQIRSDKATMTADLVSAMGSDFLGADILAQNFVEQGKVKLENGKTVFIGEGENTINTKDYFENFAKERPELVTVDVTAGTETTDGEDLGDDIDLNEAGLEDLGL